MLCTCTYNQRLFVLSDWNSFSILAFGTQSRLHCFKFLWPCCSLWTLGCVVGDRLEPSRTLPNIHVFEDVRAYPFDVVFWRTSVEAITRHRNPIFAEKLGVSFERSMSVDVLHCIYLGVMILWCKHVMWLCLLNGVRGGSGTLEERIDIGLEILQRDITRWCKCRHEANTE